MSQNHSIQGRGSPSWRRQAFLLQLADTLRALSDPVAVQASAAQMLGSHLGVNRAHYAEVVDGGEYLVVADEYTDAAPPVTGRRHVDKLGPMVVGEVLAGRTVVVEDADEDPRLGPADRAAAADLGVRAYILITLTRSGRPVSVFAVHQTAPREWTPGEVALVEEAAERTQGAVERARAAHALRDSEERYRTLFTSIDAAFCIVEVIFSDDGRPVDYRFLETNPVFEKYTGLLNAVGKTVRELEPQRAEEWVETYGSIALTGRPARFMERAEFLDNRWFDVHAFRAGRPEERKVAILFNDITAQKEAELALREGEEQFRSIFENASVGVLQTDSAGNVINANQTFCEMIGCGREDIIGRHHADFVHPDYKARPREFYRLLDGEISQYERDKQYLRSDGSSFWAAVSVSLHRDQAGDRKYTINVIRDIDERKRAQDALQAELVDNARLQEISTRLIPQGDITLLLEEILDAAIFVARADMGNVQMRDEETGSLNIVASRGLEKPFLDFFATVTGETDSSCGVTLRSGGRTIVPDIETSDIFAGKPGGEVMKEAGIRAVQSTLLISRTGRVLGMISTHWKTPHTPSDRALRLLDTLARQAADLFDRHQSEVALRKLNETLGQRVKERTASLEEHASSLRRLLSELTEAEQNERYRIAQLVHDHLQQLLIASKMRISVARLITDWQSLGETLDSTERLLDSAITEARSLTVELRPPALYESGFISALRWLAGWMQETHRLKVELDYAPAAEPTIEQGAAMLFEATRELLLNVVKHSGVNQCYVRLTREEGDMMCLAVSDRGKGFDPALAGERSTSTGLGLFSINERLSVIGGELTIESAPGRTVVRLFAPLDHIQPHTESAASAAADVTTDASDIPPRAETGVIRILLADDHSIVREGIVNTINQAPDLLVIGEAPNGKTAVELAESLRPDVVVLDVNMPIMNGIAAARAITSRFPGTRIVGLSIHDDEGTQRAMIEAGACAYVTKDAPAEQLRQAIRDCTESAGEGTADPATPG